jgi:hypothetical protein
MDIKKLTQEVLLKNMTPEQQMAVLDSVQASVKEAKAVQKQKIAENVDLVLQALKRIEADMLKRVDGAASVVEDRVKTIKDGKDGKNGLNGKVGKDGINGKDGKDGRDGRDGINGISGERGQDGVGVRDAHIDFDGSLIISLTDGQELNVGEVVPFDVAEKIRVIGNGGGTSQYVIDTLASLQTQINAVSAGLIYKGTWNASTNTPSLASGTGTNGWYYVVSVAGSTNLNGVTDWQVGDWAIFNGTVWQKIDQTNLVTSVAGRTGDVTLSTSDISGLGTIATQAASNVAITGGTINNTSIGATTRSSGDFTTLSTNTVTSTTPVLSFNAANTIASFGSTTASSYNQLIIQNKSSTAGASTNYVLSNNLGTDSTYYGEFGMNASTYSTGTPADFFSLNNLVYFSSHDGDVTVGSGNGYKTYVAWGTAGDKAHVVNASGAIGLNTNITGTSNFGTSGQVLTSGGSAATPTWTTPTTGTVTSVGGTGTVSGLTLTGTVTSTGNLTLGGTLAVTPSNFASQTANTVLAAPNGSAGTPTFRAIVAADIPTLNQNTTGSAATVTTTISSGAVATTQTAGDNSTKVATTAYVNAVTGTGGLSSFKNRIINGNFEIWQRGVTSRTFGTAGSYSADRWCRSGYQDGAHERVAVSSAVAGMTSRYAIRVTSSTTGEAASGTRMDLGQKVENVNCFDLAGQDIIFSFWIRFSAATATSSTGTPYSYFSPRVQYNTSTTDSATFSDTGDGSIALVSLANGSLPTVWTKVTATGTLPSTTKNITARFQFDGLGNTASSGTVWYEVTEVQIEKGSTATSFDYRPYGTELALCQRYFTTSYDSGFALGTSVATNSGGFLTGTIAAANSTSIKTIQLTYPVTMRAIPTLSIYDTAGTSGKVSADTVGAYTANQAYGLSNPGSKSFLIFMNNSFNCAAVVLAYAATAEL